MWQESGRSSQALVAEAIGVRPSVLSGWKAGASPRGATLAKLLLWAEAVARRSTPPASISDYHRGVLHAARAMSATVSTLLAEFDAFDVTRIDAASLRATPSAPDRQSPDGERKAGEG